MQVVAIMRDVAIMRNVCSRPALSGFKTTVRQRKNSKNFVDVVLKREHSWTNTAIKGLISSAKQEGSPLITGEKLKLAWSTRECRSQADISFFHKIPYHMPSPDWRNLVMGVRVTLCCHVNHGWRSTPWSKSRWKMHMELENKRDIDCPA